MRMRVRVLWFEFGRRHSHHQAAVLHTLEADEQVGEVLDAGGLAVHDQDFKAGIVVEMRMAG